MTSVQKKTWRSKYEDQGKINQLSDLVLKNVDDIYDLFGVEHRRGEKIIFSECFIHGGDNTNALNLYHNADYRVHYKCRTHQCEKHFGTSLLSMVRGGLSKIKYGWSSAGDKTVSFDQTIDFLLDRYKIKFNNLDSEEIKVGNYEFCKTINALGQSQKEKGKITRDFYRDKVDIPSKYYLDRGYSIEVLDDYDVGTCRRYGRQMFNRAVVPIYDEDGETIVGCTGRSLFEECKKCRSYHNPSKDCFDPKNEKSFFIPKWRHSSGFKKEKHLYNFHKAKEHVLKSGVIILVESPGNVWRLEEEGIHNSVAIFGTTLNDEQKYLIDSSGALTIVLIMDNDDAGQEAAEKIIEQCNRTYRVYNIKVGSDVADMNTNEITEDILPIINKAKGIL